MKSRLFLLLAVVTLPIGLQIAGVIDFFNLQYLKQNEEYLLEYKQQHPLTVLAIFISTYMLVCALPIPAVAILTVAGGMLFGFTNGLLVVSFSSTIGATFAFWIARYLGQDFIHRLFGMKISTVDLEMEKNGFLYATSLRFIPGIPFFITNTALGLTTIKTSTFYFSTQIGMLVMLTILVNAGHNLAGIKSLEDVLSIEVILSLSLMAMVPLIIRKISTWG